MDLDNLTPNQVADHLAAVQEKARKAAGVPKFRGKGAPRKKPGRKPARSYGLKPQIKALNLDAIMVTLNLRASHNVNGIMYGPGKTVVSAPLARQLEDSDRRAVDYDETWRNERAGLIGPATRNVPGGAAFVGKTISPALFDSMNGNFQAGHRPLGQMSGQEPTNVNVGKDGNFNWGGTQ